MKTAELMPPALDWAVSKANNPPGKEGGMDWWERDAKGYLFDPLNECTYSPSTNWSQGGPIIEREGITLRNFIQGDAWDAQLDYEQTFLETGPTPLIAAMRCYVASKIGDTVEIPEELT